MNKECKVDFNIMEFDKVSSYGKTSTTPFPLFYKQRICWNRCCIHSQRTVL